VGQSAGMITGIQPMTAPKTGTSGAEVTTPITKIRTNATEPGKAGKGKRPA
jgi:hypothetical protein